MRGTKSITHGSSTDPRITPACAGNSSFMRAKSSAIKDHPRVCGEQIMGVSRPTVEKGSPPRVRGTEERRMKPDKEARITPACAGNSGCWGNATFPGKDHPRVCGEQGSQHNNIYPILGSPPRVRGTAIQRFRLLDDLRITPACAGNSRHRVPLIGGIGDHPRVCGEQFCISSVRFAILGSPPRVRGTVIIPIRKFICFRITPACAGNSPPLGAI